MDIITTVHLQQKKIAYNITDIIDSHKRARDYWLQDINFKNSDDSDYIVDRAIWTIAQRFANNKEFFERLHKNYPVKEAMKNMSKKGDEKLIRISASIYLLSPKLFRSLIKLKRR